MCGVTGGDEKTVKKMGGVRGGVRGEGRGGGRGGARKKTMTTELHRGDKIPISQYITSWIQPWHWLTIPAVSDKENIKDFKYTSSSLIIVEDQTRYHLYSPPVVAVYNIHYTGHTNKHEKELSLCNKSQFSNTYISTTKLCKP